MAKICINIDLKNEVKSFNAQSVLDKLNKLLKKGIV